MAATPTLVLRILRVPDGSVLVQGTGFPLAGAEVVVGRAPDADVVLADGTVSRQHLRVLLGPPVRIEALTASNGTFLDDVPLPPGELVEVPAHAARLQLGGVVVALVQLADTEPVLEPLGAGGVGPTEPVLAIQWDAGQCVARCGGRDLGLTGAAARFLGLLAEQPGEVVHHWDLEQELDTTHLAPLATAARHALLAAIRAGALSVAHVRARVRAATVDTSEAETLPDLMRDLVQSRRGHGYVLNLTAEDVVVARV